MSAGEFDPLQIVLMNTSFCKELFDNLGNVSTDVKEPYPGVELREAYLVMIIFGALVLMFSYGFIYSRKKYHHDQVMLFKSKAIMNT